MRACIRCKNVKFWFQFTTEFMGIYTAVYDVCRKCTKELGKQATRELAAPVLEGKK